MTLILVSCCYIFRWLCNHDVLRKNYRYYIHDMMMLSKHMCQNKFMLVKPFSDLLFQDSVNLNRIDKFLFFSIVLWYIRSMTSSIEYVNIYKNYSNFTHNFVSNHSQWIAPKRNFCMQSYFISSMNKIEIFFLL